MRKRGFDLAGQVEQRRDRGLYREREPADCVGQRARFAPDPDAGLPVPNGETSLVFASNNYLGLADDSRVTTAAADAAAVVGAGAGASRLVTGDTLVHRDLEDRLADAKGTEQALAFSSGYAANVGTIAALGPDVIFSDELNHASIIDGCRLAGADTVVYDHCDATDLAHAMEEHAGGGDETWLIVTDSVFSMDGTVAPLERICSVAEEYGAWVLVDEAHATGVFDGGGGVVQREGLTDSVQIQLGTLSKALGSQGGYVAGSTPLVQHLVNTARSFVFSTGLAPPAAAAAGEALHIARTTDHRERLWENVAHLRDGLIDAGFEVIGSTHICPVLIGDRNDAVALDHALTERGVVAPAIRPPTVPDGESRIRVAPMATHTEEEIDACITAFRGAARAVGIQ